MFVTQNILDTTRTKRTKIEERVDTATKQFALYTKDVLFDEDNYNLYSIFVDLESYFMLE